MKCNICETESQNYLCMECYKHKQKRLQDLKKQQQEQKKKEPPKHYKITDEILIPQWGLIIVFVLGFITGKLL